MKKYIYVMVILSMFLPMIASASPFTDAKNLVIKLQAKVVQLTASVNDLTKQIANLTTENKDLKDKNLDLQNQINLLKFQPQTQYTITVLPISLTAKKADLIIQYEKEYHKPDCSSNLGLKESGYPDPNTKGTNVVFAECTADLHTYWTTESNWVNSQLK